LHNNIDHFLGNYTSVAVVKQMLYREKAWQWKNLVNLLILSIWQMNIFSRKVIIVSRNLDGFSLANHG